MELPSAASSHSASVGRRQPLQRANASASKKLAWHTGVSSNAESGCQPRRVKMRQPVLPVASRSQYSGARHPCFLTASQPSESQNSGRVYPSSDINSRYSRHVTLRFTTPKASRYTLWRGVSLSKQKSRQFVESIG